MQPNPVRRHHRSDSDANRVDDQLDAVVLEQQFNFWIFALANGPIETFVSTSVGHQQSVGNDPDTIYALNELDILGYVQQSTRRHVAVALFKHVSASTSLQQAERHLGVDCSNDCIDSIFRSREWTIWFNPNTIWPTDQSEHPVVVGQSVGGCDPNTIGSLDRRRFAFSSNQSSSWHNSDRTSQFVKSDSIRREQQFADWQCSRFHLTHFLRIANCQSNRK